jgi:RHS repeat-associated protein
MKTLIIGLLALFLAVAATLARAGTVTYVYSDPQGTPLAEADANGNVTATFDYRPYGAQALGGAPNGPGYTGHVNDPDTGLVYMQARYYDALTARFLSTDPIGPGPGDIWHINRFVYANDNPVRNIDLDGRESAQLSLAGAQALTQDIRNYDSKSVDVMLTALTLLPGIGDVPAIGQAIAQPSTANVVGAVVGLAAPLLGRAAADGIRALKAIPGKGAVAGEAVQLAKQLASKSQLAELSSGAGVVTHGAGTGAPLQQAGRLASAYGGKPENYQKVSSAAYTAADGAHVETHAYRNVETGQIVEPKTIINPKEQ